VFKKLNRPVKINPELVKIGPLPKLKL
jgi:hypothetical protein